MRSGLFISTCIDTYYNYLLFQFYFVSRSTGHLLKTIMLSKQLILREQFTQSSKYIITIQLYVVIHADTLVLLICRTGSTGACTNFRVRFAGGVKPPAL